MDNTGYNFFTSVVTQRYNFGHVDVNYVEGQDDNRVMMELRCGGCWRYVCVEFDSRSATNHELQQIRATLLSYISGCEYTRPGSDALIIWNV